MNGLDGLFSRQNRTMSTDLGQNLKKMKKIDQKRAYLKLVSSLITAAVRVQKIKDKEIK